MFLDMKNEMSETERNIIVGSLLGNGSLALYDRSKNAYYREHGSQRQSEYRRWNSSKLCELGFKYVYSSAGENLIITLINSGYSYNYISQTLNRSYWGVTDKIKRLKKEGKI